MITATVIQNSIERHPSIVMAGQEVTEQPNKETIAAMLEAEHIAHDPSVKRYSDVDEALRALKE